MDYSTILNRIEEQKRDEHLTAKLFRYTGIIQAIEFFSQKLNFEQIMDAAFDFVNELLTLERSAMFVISERGYVLKKVKGYDIKSKVIKNTEKLKSLAALYGTLIHDGKGMERFFEKADCEAFNVTTIIPLIMDNNLYGFIFIPKKAGGELNSEDFVICEALMRLINNALENYKRYEELQKANRELDEKVFNLFAINQSSKALLSELDIDILYNLSIDVFSELTQSSITSFFLYDEKSEQYGLKACRDVFSGETPILIELTPLTNATINANRVIFDLSKESDRLYFDGLFKEGLEALSSLKPLYIVMLIKNCRILGFVTLGSTVTGTEYKKSVFELIESLASATYIAVSNAQLFLQVNEQKKVIQNKLDKVISLNNLMKNINSSMDTDTLLELTAKTLEISFDVEKCFIALYNKDKNVFRIVRKSGIELPKAEFRPNGAWKRVFEGDTVFETTEKSVYKFFSKNTALSLGKVSGMALFPIYIDRLEVELIGVIAVFKFGKVKIGDEESMLTIETIAGHIAPVVSNLYTLEEQKRFLLPNYIELFKKDLKEAVNESLEYSMELDVVRITDKRDYAFKGNNMAQKLKDAFNKIYPFTNNVTFIIEQGAEDTRKKLSEAVGDNNLEISMYKLGKDFASFQDFFKLF